MNEPLSKDLLYGDFRDGMAKRERLALKAAYKALDIPPDDMNINASRTTHGIGTMGAVGIALAAGLPSAALAAWLLFRPAAAPVVPPPEVKAPVNTTVNKGFLIELVPPPKKDAK